MRTDLLTHWTGKDITLSLDLTSQQQSAYAQRVISILLHGFWMSIPQEITNGASGSFVKIAAPMTCFTETRLSQAKSHSDLYGRMGIVVNRCWVLDRFGGPVHYVRNHDQETVIGNIQALNLALNGNTAALGYLTLWAAFVKGMSNQQSDDFQFLNENEWRIVHSHKQQQLKKMISTGHLKPKYLLPIGAKDVQLIVMPDTSTRQALLNDPSIAAFFGGFDKYPPVVTIAECEHL